MAAPTGDGSRRRRDTDLGFPSSVVTARKDLSVN
jgi:hypothetical protein